MQAPSWRVNGDALQHRLIPPSPFPLPPSPPPAATERVYSWYPSGSPATLMGMFFHEGYFVWPNDNDIMQGPKKVYPAINHREFMNVKSKARMR